VALRWRQQRFNPIRSLTPQSLSLALDSWDAGWLRNAALLWDAIEERDDILAIAAPKRRKAVSRRPWSILTVDDTTEAARHAEALKFFFNNLTATSAIDRNERGGFSLLVRDMMRAQFMRYAVHEIVWQPRGKNLTAQFTFVPLAFFENTTGALRYTGPESTANGSELEQDGWLVTCGDPLFKAASICYLFKRFSLQDWINFSEKFGIPGIHGKTPATPGTPEWDKFVDALARFANDYVLATTEGVTIDLIEAKTGTTQIPFAPMVERMDRRLAAMCRGADLSTLSAKDQTGASLQSDESDLLLEDDCAIISETLQTQVARVVIRTLFGPVEPLAYLQIAPPAHTDTQVDIAVDKHLLDAGGELDAQETYERYGREMPEGMAEGSTLKARTQASPAQAPGSQTPATTAENDLLTNALSQALGVSAEWLAPLNDLLADLEAKAADGISDAEMLDFMQQAANRLPELFKDMKPQALADELEAAMGTAVINGVTTALRNQSAGESQ
jgi:phage gp29-like protein